MDGLHILNQSLIMEIAHWYAPALFIIGLLVGVCFMIAFNTHNEGLKGLCIPTGIILFIIFIIIGAWEPKAETDRYRYEAIVGDYIRFTDVYEKYNVVERRGEIWVLEDKEK